MKIYINISQYDVLEVEGELVTKKLMEEREEVRHEHLHNGFYAPYKAKVNVKLYEEIIKINKKNGDKENLTCHVIYENNKFVSRICDKIIDIYMNNGDISIYGKEINKKFIGLLSTQDIAEKYNINESTVRKAVLEGRLKEEIDCKKFGKSWVIKEEAAEKLWGAR